MILLCWIKNSCIVWSLWWRGNRTGTLPNAPITSRSSPRSSLMIMLCSIMQHLIINLSVLMNQHRLGSATIPKRACNTSKALSTSFRVDSCACANNCFKQSGKYQHPTGSCQRGLKRVHSPFSSRLEDARKSWPGWPKTDRSHRRDNIPNYMHSHSMCNCKAAHVLRRVD